MWLATLAFCHFSFASTDVSFWNSSVNNRLNQIEVRAVLQDGSGALWFATQEGLTRYNGVRADTFSAANSESGGLQPGEVRSFSVSTEGHLWVLTNTLQVFVPETQSFSVFPELDDTLFPNTIAFDADGLLWVGLDGAVGLINATTGSVEAFELPEMLQFIPEQRRISIISASQATTLPRDGPRCELVGRVRVSQKQLGYRGDHALNRFYAVSLLGREYSRDLRRQPFCRHCSGWDDRH